MDLLLSKSVCVYMCGIARVVWIGGLEIKVRCLISGLQRSMLDIILSPRVSLCRHRAFCSPRLLVALLSFHTQFFLVFYTVSYHEILKLLNYCCVSWPHPSVSVIEYHVPKRVALKLHEGSYSSELTCFCSVSKAVM